MFVDPEHTGVTGEASAVAAPELPGSLSDDQRAVVEQHLYMIPGGVNWAQRRRAWIVDREEGLADAAVGLCDAGRRFDPSKQVTFAAFAPQRIGGEVIDGERRYNKLGGHKRQQPAVVSQLNRTRARSLDAVLWDDDSASLYDVIADPTANTEDDALLALDQDAVYKALGELVSPRQIRVFFYRARLFKHAEIARELGVSERTVQRDYQTLKQIIRAKISLDMLGIETE